MPWWCDSYGAFLFVVGAVLIVAAGAAALIEIAQALRTKRAAVDITESTVADSVKALEAFKGVLEAIKGLPPWIPIFLAGLALVWLAGQRPEACTPVPAQSAAAPAATIRTAPTTNRKAP